VEVRHGEGTFVRGLGAHLFDLTATALDAAPRELIETRLHIEPIVVSLAVGRISEAQLAMLESNVTQQRTLINSPNEVASFTALGLQFHADLAPACGNGLLADIVRQLVDVERHPVWALVNQRGMIDRAARQQQVAEHRAIVQAIRRGRADFAAQVMRAHLGQMELQVLATTAPDRVAG
jgi:GntR family uxuAB operon transcriptional repressor